MEGFVFAIPEEMNVAQPSRRFQRVRLVPRQYENYTEGQELDEVLEVKKNTCPKDRKKKRMEAKYKMKSSAQYPSLEEDSSWA